MRTRKEAVELAKSQLNDFNRKDKQYWHYGYVELRELLDFIYESEPKDNDEKLIKSE